MGSLTLMGLGVFSALGILIANLISLLLIIPFIAFLTGFVFFIQKKTNSEERISRKEFAGITIGLSIGAILLNLFFSTFIWENSPNDISPPTGELTSQIEYKVKEFEKEVALDFWTELLTSSIFIAIWLYFSIERLRDAGRSITNIWYAPIPFANIILFFELLLRPSK